MGIMENKETQLLIDLQKEWRSTVLEKLSKLEHGQETLNDKFSAMQASFVGMNEYLQLKEDVISLKEFRLKFITIVTCVQVAGALVVWWAANFGQNAGTVVRAVGSLPQ